jgi:hypothetical protein
MEFIAPKSEKSASLILFLRTISMILCVFGVFYAVIAFPAFEDNNYTFLFGLVVSFCSEYFYKRLKVFHSISDDSIVLTWKSKITTIPISDIKSISKNYRFTSTEDFLWILRLKTGRFRLINFFIFPNEKEYDLKKKFEKIGIL